MFCLTEDEGAEHGPAIPGSHSTALTGLFSWGQGGSESVLMFGPGEEREHQYFLWWLSTPHQFCGKTPVYKFMRAVTLERSVSHSGQCISFILNGCIDMSKLLSQNFPRICNLPRSLRFPFLKSIRGTSLPDGRAFLKWLGGCLQGRTVCSLFPKASVQSLARSGWHCETSGVSSAMTSLVSGRASASVQVYFSNLGMNWSVLCCSPCRERCYEMMSVEVTTGLEDFVGMCAFHLSLTHVSSCYCLYSYNTWLKLQLPSKHDFPCRLFFI